MSKLLIPATHELLVQHFSKKSTKTLVRSGNTCVLYERVSGKDQMVNGNSLVWQYERMDEYALKNSYFIKCRYGGTYESAKTDERKEFQRMLADIQKDTSISTILVYSYDRFSRSGANGIFLLENLRKLGVRIIAITQEVASFTPTGDFQENLYMLLSKLDNDMRKDKSVSGTKSMLRRGYWPYSTPLGYTNTNIHTTADKHNYEINETGRQLLRAFEWKASEKYTNQQIVDKLASKGIKVSLRHIAWIFSNTFYCGYICSSLLPGEVIKGHHPILVSEKIFFLVNNISRQNSRSGELKKVSYEELPLKVFVKDAITGSPFTGYYNKTKDLFYYKSRDKGSKVSVSAKFLNQTFEDILETFEYKMNNKDKLRLLLQQKLKQHFVDQQSDEKINKKRISELQGQLNILEERFVLNEISKEQYEKYRKKYAEEIRQLLDETKQHHEISSNLEKAVEKGLEFAENFRQLWITADYYEKQKLQYLVFPEGILYNKKNNTVLTSRVNSLLGEIAVSERVLDDTKKDNPLQDCLFGSNVGMTTASSNKILEDITKILKY